MASRQCLSWAVRGLSGFAFLDFGFRVVELYGFRTSGRGLQVFEGEGITACRETWREVPLPKLEPGLM